jgi:succinyl-CoA synthetase beta subunit
VNIHPAAGLQPYQCRRWPSALGFKGEQIAEFQKIAMALYKLYIDKDLGPGRGQPADRHEGGKLLALDAKINIDPNAVFRQKELAAMRDDLAGRRDGARRPASTT